MCVVSTISTIFRFIFLFLSKKMSIFPPVAKKRTNLLWHYFGKDYIKTHKKKSFFLQIEPISYYANKLPELFLSKTRKSTNLLQFILDSRGPFSGFVSLSLPIGLLCVCVSCRVISAVAWLRKQLPVTLSKPACMWPCIQKFGETHNDDETKKNPTIN